MWFLRAPAFGLAIAIPCSPTGIEAQFAYLPGTIAKDMTFEGPQMDPSAATLSIIAFIKHVQAMPSIGRLIMVGVPIADHVATNDPDYSKHVVVNEGLDKTPAEN